MSQYSSYSRPNADRSPCWARSTPTMLSLLVGHDAANLRQGHGGPQDPRLLYTAEQVAAVWRPYADMVRAEAVERPVTGADGPRTAIDALVRAVRT